MDTVVSKHVSVLRSGGALSDFDHLYYLQGGRVIDAQMNLDGFWNESVLSFSRIRKILRNPHI